MIYHSLIILSYLLFISSSKPADECPAQDVCMDVSKETLKDGKEYRVCLTFNTARTGCNKFDAISHSCYSPHEHEKIEGWKNGDAHKMCQTVKCQSEAHFGVKDGKGCGKSKAMRGLTRPGISDIRCEYTGGYCGGGNKEDCTWSVPTPKCPPTGSCPDGSNPVNCLVDPCTVEKCAAYPDAQCEANYCGGCNAIFSVDGVVLTDEQCKAPECDDDEFQCPDGTMLKKEGKDCQFPECPPPVGPPCTPEGATFVGDNTFCTVALFFCDDGFKYWNLPNCGCGCEPDFGSTGECLVDDTTIADGDVSGHIGRTCTSDTTYNGDQTRCVKGELIDEPYQGDCNTEVPYSVCCQSGPPGDLGAATCVTSGNCKPYKPPTPEPTTPEPTTPEPTTPEPTRPACDPGIPGYIFGDFASVCNGAYYYPNCGVGYVAYSDECGCGCRPQQTVQQTVQKVAAQSPRLQAVDHNVNNIDGYNGWSDMQFLMLNAVVSVVTCLLVIALCLTAYHCVYRCNRKKYQVLDEVDVEEKV